MRPLHIGLAVLTAVIWGLNFVVIRWGLDELPPLLFTALRFTVAALPLPFLGLTPPARWPYVLGIGIFLGALQFGLLFSGMKAGMPAGLASLIMQTQAFFTVLLAALLLGDRPGPRQILGIAIAFLGVVLIASELGGHGSLPGLLLCLAAALSWGAANIFMKKAQAKDMLRLMVWISLVPPLPLIGLSLLVDGPDRIMSALTHISAVGIGAVLFNAVAATLIGYGAWAFLLRTYSASLVAPFSFLVPIFGMSSAALLLGEALTPTKALAGLLILAGLMLTVLPGRRPQPAAALVGGR